MAAAADQAPPIRVNSEIVKGLVNDGVYKLRENSGSHHYGDGWEDRELTPEEVADFYKAFKWFDEDETGFISLEQLEFIFRGLGHETLTDDEIKAMIVDVDTDGSQTIDFQEFLKFIIKNSHEMHRVKELRRTFDLLDGDGSGLIPVAEVRFVIEKLCVHLMPREIDFIINSLEKDESGETIAAVSWEAYKSMLMGADAYNGDGVSGRNEVLGAVSQAAKR